MEAEYEHVPLRICIDSFKECTVHPDSPGALASLGRPSGVEMWVASNTLVSNAAVTQPSNTQGAESAVPQLDLPQVFFEWPRLEGWTVPSYKRFFHIDFWD